MIIREEEMITIPEQARKKNEKRLESHDESEALEKHFGEELEA